MSPCGFPSEHQRGSVHPDHFALSGSGLVDRVESLETKETNANSQMLTLIPTLFRFAVLPILAENGAPSKDPFTNGGYWALQSFGRNLRALRTLDGLLTEFQTQGEKS